MARRRGGDADDHLGAWQRGDTAGFTESLRHQERGHRQDADGHAATVNDGNGGNNYTVTFVPDTTGVITAARHHGDGRDQHQDLRRHDDRGRHADDHSGSLAAATRRTSPRPTTPGTSARARR